MNKYITTLICILMTQLSTAEIFVYNFETDEGFTTGPITGQNGWRHLNDIIDQPTVDDLAPSLGAQHGRISKDATAPTGSLSGALSPSLGIQPSNKSPSVSVDLYFSDLDGAAYDILAQSISPSLITWRVRFTSMGDLQVYDSPGGMNGFVDTGVQYPVGSYFKLYVETKTQENEINYYIDDTLVYSGVAGAAFGQAIGQVVFVSNNQHATDDEFLMFDQLIIDTENVNPIFADSFESVE